VIEALESRQLLAAHVYTVPSGHTAVYLIPKSGIGNLGKVEVHLDSLAAAPVSPNPFDNVDGTDVIDCGSNTNFLFVDRVPAAQKPGADGDGDSGINVLGGNNGTLEVDAGENDTLIELTGA
jgi:hypothetical protein